MKTYVTKKADVDRKWYVIDATDVVLGKLAVKVANILRGKEKAVFSPAVDCGDYVIILNSDKVRVTGKKEKEKIYYRHSGYPGGLKKETFEEAVKKDSRKVIIAAVKGMLPKNKLSSQIIKKLEVFKGDSHPHKAQNPVEIKID